MECPVCMEEFDAAGRRPKSLPCGHTVCTHCLEGLRENCCPECRKDFTLLASALPDNFAILGLVGNRNRTDAPPPKLWCRDCDKAAVDSCADLGHTLCSLRKLRSEQAAPKLQLLEDAATAASRVVRTLEDAKDAVEGLLQEWRARLRQVQEADRELRAAVDEGGDLEAGQPEGLQQLQDAASLLEGMECGLRHQDGTEWRGDLGGGRSLLDALVLHLHRHGRIHKEPAQQQPAVAAPPTTAVCIQELDLSSLIVTPYYRLKQEMAATLARVRQHGMRRMTGVWCSIDPAWVLDVLRSAALTLEELSVANPREEHLLAAHAVPGLRRMDLWCDDGALDAQPPCCPPCHEAASNGCVLVDFPGPPWPPCCGPTVPRWRCCGCRSALRGPGSGL